MRKIPKSFFITTVALATLTSVFFSCKDKDKDPDPVTVTGITLSDSVLTLAPGETATLTATLKPVEATTNVNWTSSKPAVATVSERGVVTAVAAGKTTITAVAGGFMAQAEVIVGNVSVTFKGETWVAQAVECYAPLSDNEGNTYFVIAAYKNADAESFPYIEFYAQTKVHTYTYKQYDGLFDYYHNAAVKSGNYYYGDWWVDSGTLTVTAYGNDKVSGFLDIIAYDAQGDEGKIKLPLQATFKNVPVEALPSSAPALKSPLQLNRLNAPKVRIIEK